MTEGDYALLRQQIKDAIAAAGPKAGTLFDYGATLAHFHLLLCEIVDPDTDDEQRRRTIRAGMRSIEQHPAYRHFKEIANGAAK